MLQVVEYLQENGFKCFVVSGSDRFIVRTFIEGMLDIPSENIIGSDTALEASGQGSTDGIEYVFTGDDKLVRTDRFLIKDLKTNKVLQIAQEIGKQPVLSFGNSSGDVSMNNYALLNNPYRSAVFQLVADDDVRDYGNPEKGKALRKQWEDLGYNVISMRDDWKTIYGEDVIKTGSFHWLEDYADDMKQLKAIYLGVDNYGAEEVNKDTKEAFQYRFLVAGKEVLLGIDSGEQNENGEYEYPVQNVLKEQYPFEITVKGDTVVSAREIREDGIPAFDSVVNGIPGEKTLGNFLKIAMEPVGTTLYIYGGGWDWQDAGSSVQAKTIGVSPDWVRFFWEQDENFTYKSKDGNEDNSDPAKSYYPYGGYNEYYYAGLDCSGFLGWALYNTFETENGKDGYVTFASAYAKKLAEEGYGDYTRKIEAPVLNHDCEMKPGDIMSIGGHVWISLGTCGDGSVVILHSTPADSRTGQPGGGVELSAIGLSEECEAYQLADRYASHYDDHGERRPDDEGAREAAADNQNADDEDRRINVDYFLPDVLPDPSEVLLCRQPVGYLEVMGLVGFHGPGQIQDHGDFHDLEDVELEAEHLDDAPCAVDVQRLEERQVDVEVEACQQEHRPGESPFGQRPEHLDVAYVVYAYYQYEANERYDELFLDDRGAGDVLLDGEE